MFISKAGSNFSYERLMWKTAMLLSIDTLFRIMKNAIIVNERIAQQCSRSQILLITVLWCECFTLSFSALVYWVSHFYLLIWNGKFVFLFMSFAYFPVISELRSRVLKSPAQTLGRGSAFRGCEGDTVAPRLCWAPGKLLGPLTVFRRNRAADGIAPGTQREGQMHRAAVGRATPCLASGQMLPTRLLGHLLTPLQYNSSLLGVTSGTLPESVRH